MASEGDLCDIPAMPVRKLNHNPMETDDIEVVTIADEDENGNGTKNGEQNIIFLQFLMHNFVKQFGVEDSIKSAYKNTVSSFKLFFI